MVEKMVPSPYLRAQFQGHIDKTNGERTANIKGDVTSHAEIAIMATMTRLSQMATLQPQGHHQI
jgi:hypothetical protein